MTTRLARLSAWLIEPAPAPAGPSGLDRPARRSTASYDDLAPGVAVLAGESEVPALAASLALRLTRGAAVVGRWSGDEMASARPSFPATLAARRLAASLSARDLPARAGGRLVTVDLPADEDAAAGAARRLAGAVTAAPLVFAVAGPRGAAWDEVLCECDLVLVHAADALLADLAVARLEEQGAEALRLDATPGRLALALAHAGLALPGTLDGVAAAARLVAAR